MSDLDALRDRLAELCGWTYDGTQTFNMGGWRRGDERCPHPFDDGDLTALAGAWPEGLKITIEYTNWEGRPHDRVWVASSVSYSYVGTTEYEARLRLTVAVREQLADFPPPR